MNNFADRLIEKIKEKDSVVCVGLDPRFEDLPSQLKQENIKKFGEGKEAVAESFLEFNKKIIDSVCDIVPVVKPQMAFYEKYGSVGVKAFEQTVNYAKKKGLLVVEDAKRNDIGSTAEAYAQGHLGKINIGSKEIEGFDVDCLTVTPYLGIDGIKPFVEECKKYGKGIFVLVKTSNKSSVDLQDLVSGNKKIYEVMAELVEKWGAETEGTTGYKSVGAVVGATFPEEAVKLRQLLPKSIFLVPGYGAQGGAAKDVVPCFNTDGLGAIVNSSRGIIFAYKDNKYSSFGENNFEKASFAAAKEMKEAISKALKETKK
jgi:orotidine-5'-phosphate decarboxylase